jgi:TolA-binding protein
MRKYLKTALLAGGMMAGLALGPQAAHAQAAIEGRVDRLESEMRAVQRKVFPGGSGQYVQPEITPPTANTAIPGSPSSSPVADLEARVNALESQVSTMTGQIETTQHRVQQLEDAFNAYKRTTDARLKALEENASAVGTSSGIGTNSGAMESPSGVAMPPVAKPPAARPVTVVRPGAPATKPTTPAAPVKDAERAKRIAAVEKPPVTDDPAEDTYLYGYRLWAAKLYPEAEAVFQKVVATYPKHKRASYAQNLLGRSYLEEGNVRDAMQSFYDNFHKMPDGERAPDSLNYLAQTLIKINKPAKACEVYGVLDQVYAENMTAAIKADVARGRTEAQCK